MTCMPCLRAQSYVGRGADKMLLCQCYILSTDAGVTDGTPASALRFPGQVALVSAELDGAAVRPHPRPHLWVTQLQFWPRGHLRAAPAV